MAAKLSLGTQLETAGPVHPYTFFNAKTAVTFIRLRALIWRCHPDPLGALAGGRNEGHPPFRNRRRATSASLLKRHAPVHRTCLLLALSGHRLVRCTCLLLTQSRHLRCDQKKRRAEWPAAKGQGVESYHLGSVAIKTKPVPQRLLVQLSHRVRQKDRPF